MESSADKFARLLTALEDLTEQEFVCVRTRDFAAVAAIQRRAAPLVEHLVGHATHAANDSLRARISAVIRRRQESDDWLSAEIAQTREELSSLESTRRRAARIAPAYGSRAPEPRSRLRVTG